MAKSQAPAPIYGRNVHTQQVEFFRADIFGTDKELSIVLGRVGRSMILLRGFLLLGESFSAGTVNVVTSTGVTIAENISLTGEAPTIVDLNIKNMWNYNCEEYSLQIIRSVASTTAGRAAIVIEAIQGSNYYK